MTHVLIVDDAPDNRLIIQSMLNDDYTVNTVDSGEACLEFCLSQVPDAIILDVDMPGMNGYQTCHQLRQHAQTPTTPVIFVTGMDTPEERLAGFEAGGSAYLIKPVEKPSLVEQIERSQLTLRAAQQAQQDAQKAMSVAMEAMTSSSELGEIIEFVKNVQDTKSLDSVAELLVSSMQGFGLNICVFINNEWPSIAGCMPESMEAKLMQKAHKQPGRLLNFGIRTIVKTDLAVILVKNMPINDEAKYGRFKDHLAVLLTIAEGRILSIQASLASKAEQLRLLDSVIETTKTSVSQVNGQFEQHDNTVRAVMLNMITDLEALLFRLGLDEDQEETLVGLAYSANEKLEATSQSKVELMNASQSIVEGLQNIRGSLN